MEKRQSLQSVVLGTWKTTGKRMKLDCSSSPGTNMNSSWLVWLRLIREPGGNAWFDSQSGHMPELQAHSLGVGGV